jgi:hypothetical protein
LVLERLEDRQLLAITLNTSTWTPIGPAPTNGSGFFGQTTPGNLPVSGRITSIATDPVNPLLWYVGAAGGGVWKTADGGTTWTPLTDTQASLSVGAIAVAPSSPNTIYVGTGESNFAPDSQYGVGVLMSSDGGNTWTLEGQSLFNRRSISKIVVDPTNASTLFVAVTAFAENGLPGNTGIFKSVDGGATFTNTTSSISTTANFTDLVMDPTNPQTLYAGVAGDPTASTNVGGVYKTTNGGQSWTLSGNAPSGLSIGRVALAISKTNPADVLAAIAYGNGFNLGAARVFRTSDAGITWNQLSNTPNFTANQGWYDIAIAINPFIDGDYFAAGAGGFNSVLQSITFGATWSDISTGTDGAGPHINHHAIAFAADGTVLDATDGGLFELTNPTIGKILWGSLNTNLQITQFNSVALSPNNPNYAIGGSVNIGEQVFNGNLAWTNVDTNNSFFGTLPDGAGSSVVDPFTPTTAYHTFPPSFFSPGIVERSDDSGNTWSSKTAGININDPMNTVQPLVADPSTPGRLLFGTNRVYESVSRGNTWNPISTPNQNGWVSTAAPIDAIAVSKTSPNTIYATAGGQIFVTTNDGGLWTLRNVQGVSDHFSALTVDPNNSLVAYATRDRFGGSEVFRTVDGGRNWSDITSNLPKVPVNAIAVDGRPNLATIFVGTDLGVYASTNAGLSWAPFRTGLPNVQVKSLALNIATNILAAGTYGRGAFETQETDILQVNLTPPAFTEGQPSVNAQVGTFVDIAGADPIGNYSATIDWGDGTTTPGTVTSDNKNGFILSGSHTYAEEGKYTFNVVLKDSDLAASNKSVAINVADAPLTATGTASITSSEGLSIPVTTLATFTDSDPMGTLLDYTAIVSWGDGTSSNATITADPSGGWDVMAGHTFVEGGNSGISVTISDAGGASVSVTDPSNVADPALHATGTSFSLVEGSSTSNLVATFTDDDPNTAPSEYTAVINWGDGSTSSGGTVSADPLGGYDVTASHNYDEGQFPVTVTIQDAGGSVATAQSTATVTDASITATGSAGSTSSEGQPFSAVVATLSDNNPNASTADFSITIDWGDSTTSAGTAVATGNGNFNISGSHTYAEEGSYPIHITVKDDGGSSAQALSSATVVDSPINGNGLVRTVIEGSPFTGSVVTFHDLNTLAQATDFTATINWGDNTTSPGTVIADPAGGFDVVGSHNTFEEGNPIVTVTINDKGGASTTAVALFDILDAPLSGTGQVVLATENTLATNLPLATMKDSNPNGRASEFRVSINWGDNTVSSGTLVATGPGVFNIFGSHTYQESGPYPVLVSVFDTDGTSTVAIQAATYVQDLVVPITGQLTPASDTGPSQTDGITNLNHPTFAGTAEANTLITLYGVRTDQPSVLLILGRGISSPTGAWAIQTVPLANGSYYVLATSTDVASHTTGPDLLLPSATKGLLVIDTVGPRVLNSVLNPTNGQVTITYQDDRAGMNLASTLNRGLYSFVTNTTTPRTLPVTNLVVTASANPTAPVTVVATINNGQRLGKGSYVLTIAAAGITDLAGNTLVETHFINFPQLGNSPPGNYVGMYVVVGSALAPVQQFIPVSGFFPVSPFGESAASVRARRRP